MPTDLITALQKNGLSSNATWTATPTDRATTINPMSTQGSIELAAKVGEALEKAKEKGWDVETKEEMSKNVSETQVQRFVWLYKLINNERVKITLTSQSDSYLSFCITGSDGSAVQGLAIVYYDNNGMPSKAKNNAPITVVTSGFGRPNFHLGTFKPEDKENYKLWGKIFDNARTIDNKIYYDGKEFLGSILPDLGEVLSSYEKNQLAAKETQQPTESTIAETTTQELGSTPSGQETPQPTESTTAETTTQELGSTPSGQETPQPTGSTTKKPDFDFEAAMLLQELELNDTTHELNNTVQKIKGKNHTGIYVRGGEIICEGNVCKWKNPATSRLPGRPSIGEQSGAGMSTWAIVGAVGFLVAAVIGGGKKLYDYCSKTDRYDLEKAEKGAGLRSSHEEIKKAKKPLLDGSQNTTHQVESDGKSPTDPLLSSQKVTPKGAQADTTRLDAALSGLQGLAGTIPDGTSSYVGFEQPDNERRDSTRSSITWNSFTVGGRPSQQGSREFIGGDNLNNGNTSTGLSSVSIQTGSTTHSLDN